MRLSDFHEGQSVVYRSGTTDQEEGYVVRTNERYVFVLYRGDLTPKATSADDLSLP